MTDISKTIAPKSDQLNADDLIGGVTKIIKITKVSDTSAPDQPIAINFEGDNGKPYKPCKSMRRLLVQVWSKEGTTYVGRYMMLFRDEKVKFGGADVGGIRISHVSHIDEPKTVVLTESKTSRKPYKVRPLTDEQIKAAMGQQEPQGKPKATVEAVRAAGMAESAKGRAAFEVWYKSEFGQINRETILTMTADFKAAVEKVESQTEAQPKPTAEEPSKKEDKNVEF